jgi:hypothetical protein
MGRQVVDRAVCEGCGFDIPDEWVKGDPILAVAEWQTNAELIRDIIKVGYIKMGDTVFDATYGEYGVFWKIRRPKYLTTNDLTHPADYAMDWCESDDVLAHVESCPEFAAGFKHVVYDPPYKMNGTPTPEVDARYGVGESTSLAQRLEVIQLGVQNLAPLALERMFIKCQDAVVSGKIVWQTRMITDQMEDQGFRLRDRWDMVRWRSQPAGRRQLHAGQNRSTLLIFDRV